jgi:hypothetical protein
MKTEDETCLSVLNLANAVSGHGFPGPYCRSIQRLMIHRLTLEWGEGLRDHFLNGIACEDFETLDLDRFLKAAGRCVVGIPRHRA